MNPLMVSGLGSGGANSFHEKAGECQAVLSFFLSSSLLSLFPNYSHGAKPPLSPPFHPHSLLSDCRSVQVGCTRFSRCCHLIIDLTPLSRREVGPGVSRSHLISAVELGCLNTISLLFFAPLSFFLSFFLPSQFSTEKFRARIA